MLALAVFCAGGCALRQKPKPRPDLAHIFRPGKLKGAGITREQVEVKMFEPGDGRITRRSALAISYGEAVGDRSILSFPIFGCEIHNDLPNNLTFLDNLLSIFLK